MHTHNTMNFFSFLSIGLLFSYFPSSFAFLVLVYTSLMFPFILNIHSLNAASCYVFWERKEKNLSYTYCRLKKKQFILKFANYQKTFFMFYDFFFSFILKWWQLLYRSELLCPYRTQKQSCDQWKRGLKLIYS